MTISTMTRLDAVNEILSTAGRTPVSSLSGSLPSHVSIIIAIIDRTARELQSRDWYFNTLDKHYLSQDGNGRFPVPSGAVEVDVDGVSGFDDVILRNGFVFNLTTNTDVFTGVNATILARVHLMFDFEDLPEVAKNFVAKQSARRFAQNYVRNASVTMSAEADEAIAHAALTSMDLRQRDLSIYTTDVGARILSRRPPQDFGA